MKAYLVLLPFWGISLGAYSQQNNKIVFDPPPIDSGIDITELQGVVVEESPFIVIEELTPLFVGGDSLMNEYFRKHIRYPKEVKNGKVEGIVVLLFVVHKNGDVENVKVKKSLSPKCDKESVRVASKMPPWKPYMKDGRGLASYVLLGVYFGNKDMDMVKMLDYNDIDITIEEWANYVSQDY